MRLPRPTVLLAALLLAPLAAQAQPRPQKIGDFQSWTAASFTEGTQKTCYAFVRPSKAEGNRQEVMLTVTHRPAKRDTVTISAGYTFPRDAKATVVVGGTDLDFYTAGSTAAARDGSAAVRAFRNGKEAVMKAPGANGRGTVSDIFPLAGFGAAYEAISRECPPGGGKR